MNLPFTDRETYLAWRARWRLSYANLSQTIRECRKEKQLGARQYYRVKAREQMEIRKQSKIQCQEQYLAAKAAAAAATPVTA